MGGGDHKAVESRKASDQFGAVHAEPAAAETRWYRRFGSAVWGGWRSRPTRFLGIEIRCAIIAIVPVCVALSINWLDVIRTPSALVNFQFETAVFYAGLYTGGLGAALYFAHYRRRMREADGRLCQRCFTPYTGRGMVTCTSCSHTFGGDECRVVHGYAPFRDFTVRLLFVATCASILVYFSRPAAYVLGFTATQRKGVELDYASFALFLISGTVAAINARRRNSHVRRCGFCCCERCGHPFDWQVDESQMKSTDSDKQPPETITCTECGETFSPLAVYRRWRHALN